MDFATISTIAGIILKAVKLGPNVIQTVEDAKPFAEVIANAIGGKTMTPEQITKVEALVDKLSAEFQRPLTDDPTGHDQTDETAVFQGGE